ncbi:MAG: sugar transferase [Bacteroidales bacterium]|nr:sugar transferase [Bacteroidales bacterium]
MAKNHTTQRIKYILFDYLAASAAWVLFYLYRKLNVEPLTFGYNVPINLDLRFWLGAFVMPVAWLILYYFSGFYRNIFRRSRLDDFLRTFLTVLFGVVVIFFLLILDDVIPDYRHYYKLFSTLFLLQFTFTLIPRIILTNNSIRLVHDRRLGFNTIFIGSNENAREVYLDLQQERNSSGHFIKGFVHVHYKDHYQLQDHIPHLGGHQKLESIIRQNNVEEVIIALEPSEHEEISDIINRLSLMDVRISAIPSMTDILSGRVKSTTIFETPLLEVSHELMPIWQSNVKQLLDIFLSLVAIIILFPVEIFLIVGVKLSSPGPLLYTQERVGRYGKPFMIYKFRSMYDKAENNGPELSRKNDPRVTRFGYFMRKHRFDEIPNFINVLKGEMSLVGPRPERKYYVDKIISEAPHYIHLQKVKPGITSWGQVKYGYAENVEQMIRRLRYDLLYIENMSLFVDLKILFYTVVTIFRGSGI